MRPPAFAAVMMLDWDATYLLLFSVAYAIAVPAPNVSAPPFVMHPAADFPSINISFIKEVTLSVQPQDFDLSPHQEEEVSTFLESSLRLLDPLMRFFDGLVGSWIPTGTARPPPPQDQRFLSIA